MRYDVHYTGLGDNFYINWTTSDDDGDHILELWFDNQIYAYAPQTRGDVMPKGWVWVW